MKKITETFVHTCQYCGKERILRATVHNLKTKTCSQKCRNLLAGQTMTGQERGRTTLTCIICGDTFKTHPENRYGKRKTCCKQCEHVARGRANEKKLNNLNNRAKGWAKTINKQQTKPPVAMGPQNKRAVHCVLVTPNGKIYEFTNLQHFVRTHEFLFNDADLNWHPITQKKHDGSLSKSRGAMICKATCGLQAIKHHPTRSWKGFHFLECNKGVYTESK